MRWFWDENLNSWGGLHNPRDAGQWSCATDFYGKSCQLYKEITFRSFATLHKATQIFSFVFTRVVGWGRWGQMCIHHTSYRKFLRQNWRIRDLKEWTGSAGSNQVSTMQTSFKPQVHNQVCQLSTIKCANVRTKFKKLTKHRRPISDEWKRFRNQGDANCW